MGRPNVIYTSEHPYHITARSNNKEWFGVPQKQCYEIFFEVFRETIKRYQIQLHHFVLMSNHFHCILTTPKENVGLALRYFMTETSRGISKACSRINHIYGGRNYKCVINNSEYYTHCVKYLYRNPVKAHLSLNVEDYRWSTISKYKNSIGSLISPLNTGHDEYLLLNRNELLSYFNTPTSKELEYATARALKRSVFEFKPTRGRQKRVDSKKFLPQIKE